MGTSLLGDGVVPERDPDPCRQSARGGIRPLRVCSIFPPDLPIASEETHKVLAALGADLALLFAENE